ncbi:MAG: hypothetical protein LBD52_03855 [Prevotellaceae bacterium]|jgi:hypothetical protein|nr:hypothetical protein [Prevotellaceae bacterium]
MFNFYSFLSGAGFLPSTRRYEHKRHTVEQLHAHFHDIQSSEDFKRYMSLKTYVESPEYTTDLEQIKRLTYRNSKEHLMEKRYRELKKHKEVKAYIKKGEDNNTPVLNEFISLYEEVRSSAFKQRVVYLKNRKKHKQSDPYKCKQEYRRSKRSAMVKHYFRLHKKYASVFHEMERWKVVFEDNFHDGKLAGHWNTRPFWSTRQLSESYVQNMEEHGLDEQNVLLQGGVLNIVTKEAINTGLAWDEKYGFLPSHFNYSTGVINTAGHFQTKPKQGKIEIKLRVPAVTNTYHACWLNCGKKTPAINLFNFCNNKYEIGIYQDEYDDKICRHIKLNHSHFYVVQLEWDKNYITWRINGKKILQKPNTVDLPLYLNITSGIVGKVRASKLPAHFELDWVKIFETV